MALRSRREVPEHETWDLSPLFQDVAAWEQACARVRQLADELANIAANSFSDPAGVSRALALHDEMLRLGTDVERYAMSKFAEDATDEDAQRLVSMAQLSLERAGEASEALVAALCRVPAPTLARWVDDPSLKPYAPYFAEIERVRAHRLADDAEKALAAHAAAFSLPSSIYEAATGADMRFEPVRDSQGHEVGVTPSALLMHIETSHDTALRHRAYDSVVQGLRPYQHTLARSLGAKIQNDVVAARLRGFGNVFEMLQAMRLGGTMAANQVPPEHYFMVQDVMMRELAPHMRRLAQLRKRVMGLEKLRLCDTKAPFVPLTDAELTFDDARELIVEAATPLGSTYGDILRRAFEERWIYWARNQGNWNGAFCGESSAHPYVFSPFEGGMYGVFVMAHELGHAVHLYLACQDERPSNLAFSNLFIETPSTLMEHMVAHALLRRAGDDAARAKVWMMQMFTFHHDFVTHQTEAEILRRLYTLADRGQPLSTEVFRRVSRQVLTDFWQDAVDLDEGADLYWMRQPHYYMGLYPYTYAVGLAASTLLADRILAGDEDTLARWIEVLRVGGGKTPLELFQHVGLDMGDEAPYREAIRKVGEIVDHLERAFS
ncbi:M3 family metallopeptidase [Alicyclobacillus vulcanalis]|uniref:Oligopeptidase F. Metallo peptidase. MEROPS family M03B n=1 Tax=Alicyclobacillus vulcanalis TaxID=252246 RepID=A0A1N7PCS9_9BACL|nr:M3 family metallopeptidase [Alicyclobacillus vulcanalis]SIT08340.1 oligopeptidase F. Metallo peptidase. MEROPS family M03B [Alicyclobacillus vulcanalis]